METAAEKQSGDPLTNLEDDCVKLVAYTIVSLKRDKEKIMEEGEGSEIVTERMTSKAFTAWIIAKYLQNTKIPEEKLKPHLKYLRVYYVVSHRWPRQPMEFEERQMDALEKIRNKMA